MAVDSALIFLLVISGVHRSVPENPAFSNHTMAFLAVCIAVAWGIFALYRYSKLPKSITTSILIAVIGLFCIFCNALINRFFYGDYPALRVDFTDWYTHSNENIGVILILAAASFGVLTEIRKRCR